MEEQPLEQAKTFPRPRLRRAGAGPLVVCRVVWIHTVVFLRERRRRTPVFYDKCLLIAVRWLWSCGVVLAIAPSSFAQPASKESLDNARRPPVVSLPRDEAYIREAIREAARSVSSDRNKAIEVLSTALARLESDSQISEDRRSALARMLKGRIRFLESGPQLSRED